MEAFGSLLFPLLILLLFVPIFLQGRKQRRQMAEMQQLQASLEVGDVVTTTSGLRGTVVDVDYEDTVDLEIADGVVTTWVRRAIAGKELDSTVDAPTADAPVADAVAAPAPAAVDPADPADAPAARPAADRDGVTRTDAARTDAARTDVAADAPSDANGSSRS